jgi:uncharacterized protein YbjT (DUF2867 family)
MKRVAADATDGSIVRLPPALIQPMAADDVAGAVGRVSVGAPVNGIVEVAGPEQLRIDSSDSTADTACSRRRRPRVRATIVTATVTTRRRA